MAAVLPEMEKSILPPFNQYQDMFNLELHFYLKTELRPLPEKRIPQSFIYRQLNEFYC